MSSKDDPIVVGRAAQAARAAEEQLVPEAKPDVDGLVRRTYGIGGTALSALETAAGDPDKPTIVLLHGIPASAELWRGVMPHLADAGHRAVAFDLPGYGRTLAPARADHSLAGAAELVATWVGVIIGGPVWVVGHDLGGAVAQIVATRHPKRVRRLTLGNCPVGDSWPVPAISRLQRAERFGLFPRLANTPLVPRRLLRDELASGFADASRLTDEMVNRVFLDSKITDPDGRRAFARHLRALDNQQTVAILGALPRIAFPVQLVWGMQDAFQSWDEVGVRLRDALPDPDVTHLDDAGHFAPAERPDAWADALLDWTSA